MGTAWSKSGQIEFDNNGIPATGALAYFFQGGTTTPITTYEDGGESVPHEHPVESDGNGRWPFVVIPYMTSYDVRVTTEGGAQLYYHQEIANTDPAEGTGSGGGSVADEDLIATGDVIWRPTSASIVGRVRCNGRTMGNAASGGNERAHADTADLFAFLWNGLADGQAAVSGGRGASAAADYAANKTIALPDLRLGTIYGLDDMGNTAAGRDTNVPFTHGSAILPGSAAGLNTHIITEAQLPIHTHTFAATTSSDGAHTHTGTTASDGAHTHTVDHNHDVHGTFAVADGGATFTTCNLGGSGFTPGGGDDFGVTDNSNPTTTSNGAHTHTFTTASDGAHTHSVSGTTGSTGGGIAHNNLSYGILGTFYMKL